MFKPRRYENETEISALVEAFERGAISRADWRHAEHLTVALYHLSEYEYVATLTKMRDGIFNLLRAFQIDLTTEMPYHETLTVFWLRTIEDYRDEYKRKKKDFSMLEICNDLIENFDKNYPLEFYSRELLFSDEARKTFVAPDKKIFGIATNRAR